MAELLPCPFCGGEAYIGIDRDGEMYKEVLVVYCDNCEAQIKDHNKFMCDDKNKIEREANNIVCELVNKWNTRTPKERGGEK